MWNNKLKAITFSVDDGCLSDKRVAEIFNKYGIKATFNINSGLLGKPLVFKDHLGKIKETFLKTEIKDVHSTYLNYEIAVHTKSHINLTEATKDEIIEQVESDRIFLEKLVGYSIVGMAYPGGYFDNRVKKIISENTPIKYSRTIISTYNFNIQDDLMQFNPTIWWGDELLLDTINNFFNIKTEKPQLLYIWGHSFELERGNKISFDSLEQICKMLSNKSDVFYGTNKECILTDTTL